MSGVRINKIRLTRNVLNVLHGKELDLEANIVIRGRSKKLIIEVPFSDSKEVQQWAGLILEKYAEDIAKGNVNW